MTTAKMKYIVKNCPAITKGNYRCRFGYAVESNNYCKECTDCLLKQIVEMCKSTQVECPCDDNEEGCYCWECEKPHKIEFAKEILSMLKIQECE